MERKAGRLFILVVILAANSITNEVEGAPDELGKLQEQFALEKGILNQEDQEAGRELCRGAEAAGGKRKGGGYIEFCPRDPEGSSRSQRQGVI